MSRNFEEVGSDYMELAELANDLMDRLYLLSTEVADSHGSIPLSVHECISELEEEFADLGDQEFTFSGEGFIPYVTPDGDEETIYSSAQYMRGQFSCLQIADEEVVKYTTKDDFTGEAEELEGSLLEDEVTLREVLSELRTPPEGLQLFAEFTLDVAMEESSIGGSAIRARGVSYFAIMHAARLTLESIDERLYSEVTEDTIEEHLQRASREVYSLVHSAGFKKYSAPVQLAMLEDRIMGLNAELQLERFMMHLSPQAVLIPDLVDNERLFDYIDAEDGIAGFSVDPIRVDSLDAFELAKGRRIASNKQLEHFPYSGLCIVGEIDEATRDQLDLPAQIIWVPIIFPRNKRRGVRVPGFSAHFEQSLR